MMTQHILICTLGSTPQVVTESVWALIHDEDQPWVPDRIEIVTTADSAKWVSRALQGPATRLSEIFLAGAPPVVVYVPRRDGQTILPPLEIPWPGGPAPHPDLTGVDSRHALRDVANALDAEAMGDLIKDRIWAAVEPRPGGEDTELHVSLTGGRKTMSAHALLALALLGRVQDEGSQVLVAPIEFENNDQYWHGGQTDLINTAQEIAAAKRAATPLPPPTLSPALGQITLIRVPTPFVMELQAKERADFARLRLSEIIQQIRSANRFRRHPEIEFRDSINEVRIGDIRARLNAVPFAQLRLLAAARHESWSGAGPDGYEGHAGWITGRSMAEGDDAAGLPRTGRLLAILARALEAEGTVIERGARNGVTHYEPQTYHIAVDLESRAHRIQSLNLGQEREKLQTDFIVDLGIWLGSLTDLRKTLAGHFGSPLVNAFLPGSRQASLARKRRQEADRTRPPVRFGLLCPPEAIICREA